LSADIQQIWKKMQTNCIFIATNFVIPPQILIFSMHYKSACRSIYSDNLVNTTLTCAYSFSITERCLANNLQRKTQTSKHDSIRPDCVTYHA